MKATKNIFYVLLAVISGLHSITILTAVERSINEPLIDENTNPNTKTQALKEMYLKNHDLLTLQTDNYQDAENQKRKELLIKNLTEKLKNNQNLNENIIRYIKDNTSNFNQPNSIINLEYGSKEQTEAIDELKLNLRKKIKRFLNDASLYTPKESAILSQSKDIFNQIAENIIESYQNILQEEITEILDMQIKKSLISISKNPALPTKTIENTESPDEDSNEIEKLLQYHEELEKEFQYQEQFQQQKKLENTQEETNQQKKEDLLKKIQSQIAKWDKSSIHLNNLLNVTTQDETKLFEVANEQRINFFSLSDNPSERYEEIANLILKIQEFYKLNKIILSGHYKPEDLIMVNYNEPDSIIDNNENRLKKVEDRIAEINNNITSFQKKNGSEFVKAINIILKKTDIDLNNIEPIKAAKLICKVIKMNGAKPPVNLDWFDNAFRELSKNNLYKETLKKFTNPEQSQLFKDNIKEMVYEADPNLTIEDIINKAYKNTEDISAF